MDGAVKNKLSSTHHQRRHGVTAESELVICRCKLIERDEEICKVGERKKMDLELEEVYNFLNAFVLLVCCMLVLLLPFPSTLPRKRKSPRRGVLFVRMSEIHVIIITITGNYSEWSSSAARAPVLVLLR